MRFTKNDTPVTIAAKKAAMICTYAIKNPLHVFFEDGNYHRNPMTFERECNEEFRQENGEKMALFIAQFLDEFDALDSQQRREAYVLFSQKWRYLQNRWSKKIAENSKPREKGRGCCYRHYLSDAGSICVKTDLDVELIQF